MSKPKYCSWDVRDLAGDYNWSETSDERDVSNLAFKQQVGDQILIIHFNLESGAVSVFSETSDNLRTLVYSEMCLEFGQIENILSNSDKFYNKVHTMTCDSSVISHQSEIKTNDQISIKSNTLTNNDEFGVLQSIIHKWDREEK